MGPPVLNSMNKPQVLVRRAGRGDIGALTNLLKTLFNIEEDFTFDQARQQRGLQLLLENPASCVLVAQINGTVGGMCSSQLTISTAEGSLALLVEDVVIEKEWHALGIGRQLLDGIAQWAAEHGAYRMQLLADRQNAEALKFYNRLGWEQTQLICLRKRQGK